MKNKDLGYIIFLAGAYWYWYNYMPAESVNAGLFLDNQDLSKDANEAGSLDPNTPIDISSRPDADLEAALIHSNIENKDNLLTFDELQYTSVRPPVTNIDDYPTEPEDYGLDLG
jgi:hypothetical protein